MVILIQKLYELLACHFIGDYVLQIDFLAKTKGENWWHLIAHCVLYSVPFAVAFGIDWRIALIVITHIVIDALKARYKKINYLTDQMLHLIILWIYL